MGGGTQVSKEFTDRRKKMIPGGGGRGTTGGWANENGTELGKAGVGGGAFRTKRAAAAQGCTYDVRVKAHDPGLLAVFLELVGGQRLLAGLLELVCRQAHPGGKGQLALTTQHRLGLITYGRETQSCHVSKTSQLERLVTPRPRGTLCLPVASFVKHL